MNQFRRNPITGQWSIIIDDDINIRDFISNKQPRKNQDDAVSSAHCQFCVGFEAETPSELFAVRPERTKRDEQGWSVRVIPDKQPYLQIYGDLNNRGVGMYDVLDGIGAHELVIETPHHDVPFADLELSQLESVFLGYRERILDLKRDDRFRYVLIHKKHGEGHPDVVNHAHSHIIATPITPSRVKLELMNALEHFRYKERCIFCDTVYQEQADGERVVYQNEDYLAIAPFAPRSPFEIWVLPKVHEPFFETKTDHRLLAAILNEILQKTKTVLNNPNYVMVLHTGPNLSTGKLRGYWKTVEKDFHWHIEITPRFRGLTSFGIGSGFNINFVSPERAAYVLKTGNFDN